MPGFLIKLTEPISRLDEEPLEIKDKKKQCKK